MVVRAGKSRPKNPRYTSFIAANSSTILTHLNWGSSYLVHDFYRRFVRRDAPERHYVAAGRICTVLLYVAAGLLGLMLESAQVAFQIIISIGAGTGLLYLLRWFWWRIIAWCEVVAMISSFAISLVFFVLARSGYGLPFAQTVLYSVAFTTVCWLVAAFASPPWMSAVQGEPTPTAASVKPGDFPHHCRTSSRTRGLARPCAAPT